MRSSSRGFKRRIIRWAAIPKRVDFLPASSFSKSCPSFERAGFDSYHCNTLLNSSFTTIPKPWFGLTTLKRYIEFNILKTYWNNEKKSEFRFWYRLFDPGIPQFRFRHFRELELRFESDLPVPAVPIPTRRPIPTLPYSCTITKMHIGTQLIKWYVPFNTVFLWKPLQNWPNKKER